jgi:hypothetical protein
MRCFSVNGMPRDERDEFAAENSKKARVRAPLLLVLPLIYKLGELQNETINYSRERLAMAE